MKSGRRQRWFLETRFANMKSLGRRWQGKLGGADNPSWNRKEGRKLQSLRQQYCLSQSHAAVSFFLFIRYIDCKKEGSSSLSVNNIVSHICPAWFQKGNNNIVSHIHLFLPPRVSHAAVSLFLRVRMICVCYCWYISGYSLLKWKEAAVFLWTILSLIHLSLNSSWYASAAAV